MLKKIRSKYVRKNSRVKIFRFFSRIMEPLRKLITKKKKKKKLITFDENYRKNFFFLRFNKNNIIRLRLSFLFLFFVVSFVFSFCNEYYEIYIFEINFDKSYYYIFFLFFSQIFASNMKTADIHAQLHIK